jgi:hypothetical protein
MLYRHPVNEQELLAVHRALLEGCRHDLALVCDPALPDGVALVVLPHGTPRADIAFASRHEVAHELEAIARDEGPAAIGLVKAAAALLEAPRAPDAETLVCVVVALGRARLHEIAWPRRESPKVQA